MGDATHPQATAALAALADRAERLLECLEARFGAPPAPHWDTLAYRWRRSAAGGGLHPIARPHAIRLADLQGIDEQKRRLDLNTRQFVAGLPANNALLWGSRGTGKSSLVKALLNEYADRGLRLIEVEKHELVDLPDIIEPLQGRPERFLLFCDDLSFEADDASYKALKVVLDGSISAAPDNVLIYATSNRRHLLPEYHEDNQASRLRGGEIHHGEAVEERISLSDRFGLWLSFYPFDQEQYLAIVEYWIARLGAPAPQPEILRRQALQWALARGSRSGRSAWQFARDWAGSQGLSML